MLIVKEGELMSTNPSEKRKLRFANPQILNPDTRVGYTIVNGGFRAGDWNNLFNGLGERLKREKISLEEKDRSLHVDTQIVKRCAELGLSMEQVQQMAARDKHDILYVLGLDLQTLKPLSSRPWLSMAAQTCSVSYRSAITHEMLLEVLSTGRVPQSASAPVSYFIDEAPLQMVVMAVENAAYESGLDISVIWRHVAQIAVAMSTTRLASVV